MRAVRTRSSSAPRRSPCARTTARDVRVELDVPAATAGAATDPTGSFHDVSGLVVFTPAAGSNNGVTLRVPYYLVPQAVSRVSTSLDTSRLLKKGSAVATTTNRRGVISGQRRLVRVGPLRQA